MTPSSSTVPQSEKARRFRALHERNEAFIIPNPYDLGTARLLEQLRFEALATTSAGFAFTLGRRDYGLQREQVLAHISILNSGTNLPVSADLENGFGHEPEMAAETIRLAAAAGAVGGSIEDSTGHTDDPVFAIEAATERVRAAAAAARGISTGFVLTARAENYLYGYNDLKDTIKRLQAYQEAGADVLYAPGLATKEDIAAVVSSVDRPVNVLMGFPEVPLTLADLSAVGVKRVSVGSGLTRAALGGFLRAALEMRDSGTFSWSADAVGSVSELTARFPE